MVLLPLTCIFEYIGTDREESLFESWSEGCFRETGLRAEGNKVSRIDGRNCEDVHDLRPFAGTCCRIKTSLLAAFPRCLIAPSRSLAGVWIQYQTMRMMTGVEVEHINQRTGEHVEGIITYSA